MNFGLASAFPTHHCFQRIMASMLKGIAGVEIYLDDSICHICHLSQAERDAVVTKELDLFRAHRVRVNWSKNIRSQMEIKFLGYLISASGVRIDPERVRPLLEAADPADERSLRAFRGPVS